MVGVKSGLILRSASCPVLVKGKCPVFSLRVDYGAMPYPWVFWMVVRAFFKL